MTKPEAEEALELAYRLSGQDGDPRLERLCQLTITLLTRNCQVCDGQSVHCEACGGSGKCGVPRL
jgi:hypothetical protein